MDPVRITTMGSHRMVAGSDKGAVEKAVAELAARGARVVSKIEALGRNWVATLEQPEAAADDGCKVVRMGLQIIVTGTDRRSVHQRIQALVHEGALLKTGPSEQDGIWIAVLDESGIDRTIHRW